MREKKIGSILCRLFFLAIPFSLVAAACSGATPVSIPSPFPETTPSRLPDSTFPPFPCTATTWSLDFTRSGGLAGRIASLHLTSGGPATAAEPSQNLVIATALPIEDLTRVGKLLEAACPFASSARPTTCPDCFSYAMEIHMNGQTYSAYATDVDQSGLGALIQSLSTILDQSLSGRP
jgi:hypothetical protein